LGLGSYETAGPNRNESFEKVTKFKYLEKEAKKKKIKIPFIKKLND
jgi:hypothetical protein